MPNSSQMSEQTFAYWLTVPVAVVLVALVIYPTLYSLWISLWDVNFTFNSWKFVGLQNYVDAFTSPSTWDSVRLTITYVLWVTFISGIVGLGGALLLNEAFPGKAALVAIVILPWAVSTFAAAVIWRYMYSEQFGLFNTVILGLGLKAEPVNFLTETWVLPAIALAHSWQFSPLGMYFMLAALQVIPPDMYKLARIDRLGVIGRFTRVTFPYLKTPMFIFLVLVTAEAAKVFDIIYFLSAGGPGTASHDLVYQIYVDSFVSLRLGVGAAEAWILIILITVITMAYFKFIMMKQKSEVMLGTAEGSATARQRGIIRLGDEQPGGSS